MLRPLARPGQPGAYHELIDENPVLQIDVGLVLLLLLQDYLLPLHPGLQVFFTAQLVLALYSQELYLLPVLQFQGAFVDHPGDLGGRRPLLLSILPQRF